MNSDENKLQMTIVLVSKSYVQYSLRYAFFQSQMQMSPVLIPRFYFSKGAGDNYII